MIRLSRPLNFDAAIARRTGDELHTIRSRGFQPVTFDQPDDQDDPEAYCVDWDAAESDRHVAAFPLHRARPAVA